MSCDNNKISISITLENVRTKILVYLVIAVNSTIPVWSLRERVSISLNLFNIDVYDLNFNYL